MAQVENDDSPEGEENDAIEVIIEDDEGMDMENDSDDDSGNSANEEEKEQALLAIEDKISQNQYVYEDHVELINILSELGDPHRLDKAYDRLSSWCGLEPDQWVHRLHVAKTLAESEVSEEKIHKTHELFEKAIREVYNYQVYMLWLNFAMDLETQGDAKVITGYEPRRIIAKALDMAGSDPLHGHEFWEKALTYESQKLEQMDPESTDYEDQVHRVFDVYAGWLSKPLLENDNILQRFHDFVALHKCIKEDDVKEVREDYSVAQEILQKILPFEEKLTMFGTTTKAVSLYTDYINNINELILLGDLDVSILKNLLPMLYDRASYECCSLSLHSQDENILSLCETLLLDYAEFAKLRGGRQYLDIILDRIIKRWPRSCRFWVMRMHEQERREEGIEKIRTTLEQALASGIVTPEDSVELWMAYLEAIKRHTDFTNDDQVERLRSTFRLAWDSLGRIWGDRADPACDILLFWARLEYKIIGDFKRGKELFEEVFECGVNKTLCNVWLELVGLEARRVPPPSARKLSELFARALRFVEDWPRGVCRAWLDHERDHGSLDSLHHCKKACKDILDEWDKKVEERKMAKTRQNKHQQSKYFKGAREELSLEVSNRFPKRNVSREGPKKGARRPKNDAEARTANTKGLKRGFGAGDSPRKQTQLMPPPSVPPTKKAKIHPEDQSDETKEEDKNARTVFISNLGHKVSEEKLREVLTNFGEVEELRMVTGVKAFGGSICYCVYKDQISVAEALRNDRSLLEERPMFISRYAGDKSSRRPKVQYSMQTEKNKLFVKNIPFEDTTNERLREVFAPHGKLKEIRIIGSKTGRARGLAYVEYADEESAAAALKATDGLKLRDRQLQVAFSAPPPKSSTTDTLSGLGGGRRRGKGRTQLSAFIPRALVTPTAIKQKQNNGVASVSSEAGTSQASSTKLSNSDFRTMLLGKK